MLKRLQSLPGQLLLLIALPLVVVTVAVAVGATGTHTGAMREMVASRDERAVRAAAAGLAELPAGHSPAALLQAAAAWLSDPGHSSAADLFLVDQQGRVLAHTNPAFEQADWQQRPAVAAVLRGESGSLLDDHPDSGAQSITAFSPVEGTGWGLLMEESWDEIANPWLRYTQVAPLALIPALLLAAGALYFALRRIVQPLQRLDAQATRLGWGEFDAIEQPVGGIQEIRALQATLSRMAGRLRSAQAGMRSYAAALTRGQEEERARLARELHDETVQTLIALEHRAHMLRRALERDPAGAAGKADELAQMAAGAVQEVRRVIRALRPLFLDDLGWLPAVQALVDDLNRSGDMTALLRVSGSPRRLDPAVELTLYRITQEALGNTARHSNAQQVEVTVQFADGSVQLAVRDDGRGFAPPARVDELASAGHFGLVGMVERAQLVGASLQIESAPGRGTRIQVTLRTPELA